MRVALLGGTFDPPHLGHWLAAVDAFEVLALDRLVFVPAARQPLKVARPSSPPAARLAMVRAMVAGDARFTVDALEFDRPGLSYTVDTLESYRARPEVSALYFIIGADSLATLHAWRSPDRVQALAELIVLRRDADEVAVPDGVRARVIGARRVDVSSTEIRGRIRAGQSIRGFVPPSVELIIADEGLYR